MEVGGEVCQFCPLLCTLASCRSFQDRAVNTCDFGFPSLCAGREAGARRGETGRRREERVGCLCAVAVMIVKMMVEMGAQAGLRGKSVFRSVVFTFCRAFYVGGGLGFWDVGWWLMWNGGRW